MEGKAFEDWGDSLEAKVQRLQEDADRYRWLRDFGKHGVNINPPCEHVHACAYSHLAGTIPATRVVVGDELDRLVDAARSHNKGN